jgi:hypothetical protein
LDKLLFIFLVSSQVNGNNGSYFHGFVREFETIYVLLISVLAQSKLLSFFIINHNYLDLLDFALSFAESFALSDTCQPVDFYPEVV